MAGHRKSSSPNQAAPQPDQARPKAKRVRLYPYQKAWVDDASRFKLACKARQIGFTFAATLRVVLKRLAEPGLTVWLSASERQALEAIEQVRRHLGALGVSASFGEVLIEGTQLKQHRVSLPNRSRIIALPANPDTVRGFSGDVVLDEFAFHRDSHAIWRAAFATATRGFQLEVISTPNGTQGKYYELARQAGLAERGSGDVPKPRDIVGLSRVSWRGSSSPKSHLSGSGAEFTPPTAGRPLHHSRSVWSAHWSDVFTARALGFVVDIPSLRAAVDDEDTWQQEYCCQFLSDAAHYLPLELVVAAEFSPPSTATPSLPEPSLGPGSGDVPKLRDVVGSFPQEPARTAGYARTHSSPLHSPDRVAAGACYLGVDIGRRHDKTVLWLLAEAGGVLWTRSVQTLERAPFATQRAAIESLLALRAHNSGSGSGDDPALRDRRRSVHRKTNEEGVRSPNPGTAFLAATGAGGFLIQRCAIDATGLGAMLAEELQSRFGARVEPVPFTLAVKEDLAVRLKRRLEERRLRIPYDPAIRRALGAVKRYTTPTGHFRFDAARTDEGHADEFWALALACYAADAAPLSTEFISTQLPSAFRLAHAF